MNSITKSYALILIGIMAISCISLLTVKSASAQATSKPSVPEFTVKVVDTTLEMTIKNQPLTPYENGSYPNLYYMFRYKDNNTRIGHWDYDPMYYVLPSTYGGYYKASDSEFTIVSLSLEGHQFPSRQKDIQAAALIGKQYPTSIQNGTVYGFEGKYSDWSNTQTITIAASLNSPTPMPTPITTGNLALTLTISVIVVIIALAIIQLLYRRHRKTADRGK